MIKKGDPISIVLSGKVGLVIDIHEKLVIALTSFTTILVKESLAYPLKWIDISPSDKKVLNTISKLYEVPINKYDGYNP